MLNLTILYDKYQYDNTAFFNWIFMKHSYTEQTTLERYMYILLHLFGLIFFLCIVKEYILPHTYKNNNK